MKLRIDSTSKYEDSEKTIYRFKTKEEFEEEFGTRWKRKVHLGWNEIGDMDYLFGLEISKESYDIVQLGKKFIPEGEKVIPKKGSWNISKDMLTKKLLKKSSKNTVKLSDKLFKKQSIIKLNQNN